MKRLRSAQGVVGTLVSLALISVGCGSDAQPTGRPTFSPSAPRSSQPGAIPYLTEDQVAPQLDPAGIGTLPWHPGGTAVSWDPVDPVPLDEDPVDRAVVAIQSRYGQPPAISVLGDDGRWRSVDLTGLTLGDSYEYHVGVNAGSFSPDGATLAIGQPDAVVLVDLSTGERTIHEIPWMGPTYFGRETFWSADGSTVYMAEPAGHPRGFAVDVRSGEITPTPFHPSGSAFLDDVVIQSSRRVKDDHVTVNVYDTTDPYQVLSSTTVSLYQWDYITQKTGYGDLWAGQRIEIGWNTDDPRQPSAPASGVQILDDRGHVVRLLPVKRWGANGGGGSVLGWIDATTVAFTLWESGAPGGVHAMAWDITTDRVTRLADFTSSEGVALAPPG